MYGHPYKEECLRNTEAEHDDEGPLTSQETAEHLTQIYEMIEELAECQNEFMIDMVINQINADEEDRRDFQVEDRKAALAQVGAIMDSLTKTQKSLSKTVYLLTELVDATFEVE
jgi:hypothetical protein